MTTRLLALPAMFAALIGSGCYGAGEVPKAEEKPIAEEKPNLAVAPAPRAPGDAKPLLVVAGPWMPRRSDKPWPELIVGRWRYAQPKVDENATTTIEYTHDGKCTRRYRPPVHPENPKGVQTNTRDYRVNGNILFPASTHDDGFWVTEDTTLIESLTEGELVTLKITRTRLSQFWAEQEAKTRKVPVEQVLAEIREEQRRFVYVRLKDKDK
jgi:hypothetical protein